MTTLDAIIVFGFSLVAGVALGFVGLWVRARRERARSLARFREYDAMIDRHNAELEARNKRGCRQTVAPPDHTKEG